MSTKRMSPMQQELLRRRSAKPHLPQAPVAPGTQPWPSRSVRDHRGQPTVPPAIPRPPPPGLRRGQSPMQRELLQRRAERTRAAVHPEPLAGPSLTHPAPALRTYRSVRADPSCVQPNMLRHRSSLSPAVSSFVAPTTTSYSTPLKRRKMLLVGIGYRNHRFLRPLAGCRTDVRDMFNLLTGPLFSFPKDGVRVLCDELNEIGGMPVAQPTRCNILRDLKWLTDGINPGESVLFFFAGHGDFVEDVSGDEVETGFDQCIMPMDYEVPPTHGAGKMPKGAPPILDDTIYERLVRSVPAGAKVTAIVDACRSGTVCDLPVQYRGDGQGQYRNGENLPPREVRRPYLPAGGCVLFSGSSDSQMSADMIVPVEGGAEGETESCGIMTRSFVDALREMCYQRDYRYDGVERWSYGTLMDRIRYLVNERAIQVLPDYIEKQEPQLSTSHLIDLSTTPFAL